MRFAPVLFMALAMTSNAVRLTDSTNASEDLELSAFKTNTK